MRNAVKLTACLALLLSVASWALVPPQAGPSSLASKAFFKPELTIPITNVPLQETQAQMSAQSASAWNDFFARNGKNFNVYLDPRTGAATSIQGAIPMIPGTGVGNNVTLVTVRQQLGRMVSEVNEAVVGDLIVKFIVENAAAIGVDPLELGEPRVTKVADHLWNIHIPQQVRGVPVRHARVAAVINHGNLVLLGTEAWAKPNVDVKPAVTPSQAMAMSSEQLGLYSTPANLWQQPTLEIAPMARAGTQNGQSFIGTLGNGYSHALVWTYGFQEADQHARWKVTVDAHTGEMLALEDDNHYLDASITGGIYPSTNTEICPNNETCGTMQPNSPMPFADTGFAAPNNFTDSAGIYNYTSGTMTTTLNGRYIRITDTCGSPTFSSATGSANMGGVNGNHDCTIGNGGGAGNTAASRSGFYELNKLKEQARGWLPSNTWLQGQLTSNMNINQTCNAFWNGTTVNFYRSGGGCRNTGEIGAVFDHEWGHGMDNFDSNGTLSSSSEGYADIAAIYRLQTSCVGHGFFWTANSGCGQTADGTGFNANEAQTGAAHCNTDCSGVRDSDWAKHADNTPDTPINFVCGSCGSGTGPCGRQVHCAAAPARQAAWDFVSRDLRAAPYNYDSNTAFIVANKVFYQGSGNIGTWHACNCTGGTSDGCGATNGYMSWLAADDDNGNLSDGTPHMTAIHAAFNRHGIACTTPAPVTSGCASGPSTAPAATATPGDGQVTLNWTSTTGASEYWVMKTEGFAGCNFGKAKIATVTGNSYTDGEVANNRQYCYSIVGAATNSACYSQASECVCATPVCAAPVDPTLVGPADGATGVDFVVTLDWDDITSATYDVQVATDAAFTSIVGSATGLSASQWTVTPALSPTTQYYWRVRSANSCGGTSAWITRSFTTRACETLAAPTLSSPADGATGVHPIAPLDWTDVTNASGYDVQVATDAAFSTIVASNTTLTASTWTVNPPLNANTTYFWRARGKDACGAGTWAAGSSFTTDNVCIPIVAAYDATLRVPACGAACGCDTGPDAIKGRGTMSNGSENNRPNTVGGTCVDGNSGRYMLDESVEQISLTTVDQGPLAPGKQVAVSVRVWCYAASDKLDLYYSTNPTAATPTWTAVATGISCPATRGFHTFERTFPLHASAAGQQALRANLRFSTTPTACSTGSFDDHDDMVFTVTAPTIAKGVPGKATPGKMTATPAKAKTTTQGRRSTR